MKLDGNHTRRLAMRGMLVAVAFVLSWLEAQLPPLAAVPGVKVGLTNLVVLAALYLLEIRDALMINLVRIVLTGMTFGSPFSMIYSLAGGMLSAAVMVGLKKTEKFGPASVSVAGGISHNIGQILVAMVVLETNAVFYYLGILWFSGLAAGAAVGIIGSWLIKRLQIEETWHDGQSKVSGEDEHEKQKNNDKKNL